MSGGFQESRFVGGKEGEEGRVGNGREREVNGQPVCRSIWSLVENVDFSSNWVALGLRDKVEAERVDVGG